MKVTLRRRGRVDAAAVLLNNFEIQVQIRVLSHSLPDDTQSLHQSTQQHTIQITIATIVANILGTYKGGK